MLIRIQSHTMDPYFRHAPQQIVLDDQPCTSSSIMKLDQLNSQQVKNQQPMTRAVLQATPRSLQGSSPPRTHHLRASSRDKLLGPKQLADLDDLMERLELIHDHRIIQNLYSAGLSAFSFDDEEAASILLSPRAKMDNGQPVLMYLVQNLSDPVKQQHYVSILLSENIHVNDRDCEGKTVLMHACIKGYDKMAKSLINHPATDLMLQDRQGNTAFMYAAINGRIQVLKCFIRILNKIDKTNRYRRQQMAKGSYCPPAAVLAPTPPSSSSSTIGGHTHHGLGDLAGAHSPERSVKLLLLDSALKFVLHYKNKDGQTALDLAKIHKRKDCQELLEDAEKKVRPSTAGSAFNSRLVSKFSSHTFRLKTSQPADSNGGTSLPTTARNDDPKSRAIGGQSKSLESLCPASSSELKQLPGDDDTTIRRPTTAGAEVTGNRRRSSQNHQDLAKRLSIQKWAATKLTNAMGNRRKSEYRWSISSSEDKGGGCGIYNLPTTAPNEKRVPINSRPTTPRTFFQGQRSTTVQEEQRVTTKEDVDDRNSKLTRKSQSESCASSVCSTLGRDLGPSAVGNGRHAHRKSAANNIVQNFIIKLMCRRRSTSDKATNEKSGIGKNEEEQQKMRTTRKRSNNNNNETLLSSKKNELCGGDEKMVVPTLMVQEDSTNFEIWRTRRSDISSVQTVDFGASKSFSSASTDESSSSRTPQRLSKDFDHLDYHQNRFSPGSSGSMNQQQELSSICDFDVKIDAQRMSSPKGIVDLKTSDLPVDQRRKSKSIFKQFTFDFDKQRSFV